MVKSKNDPSTLGGRIAIVRAGMTQGDFAARLGVNRMTLVRYEKGERVPDAGLLTKIISGFGVDANWLMLGTDAPPKPELTPREAALLDNYRESPEEGKRSAEETVALLAKLGKQSGGEGEKAG